MLGFAMYARLNSIIADYRDFIVWPIQRVAHTLRHLRLTGGNF